MKTSLKPNFSLISAAAKLVNVNPRSEIHGQDKKLAVDLTIEVTGSNNMLSEFHPSLKSAFYMKDDTAQQGELIKDDNHLPSLKFPSISGFKYGAEYENYKAVVHIGIEGRSNIEMIDCKVDQFNFTLKDGGSVTNKFRIICHPTPEETGKLCGYIQQEISLSLIYEEPAANDEGAQQDLAAAA